MTDTPRTPRALLSDFIEDLESGATAYYGADDWRHTERDLRAVLALIDKEDTMPEKQEQYDDGEWSRTVEVVPEDTITVPRKLIDRVLHNDSELDEEAAMDELAALLDPPKPSAPVFIEGHVYGSRTRVVGGVTHNVTWDITAGEDEPELPPLDEPPAPRLRVVNLDELPPYDAMIGSASVDQFIRNLEAQPDVIEQISREFKDWEKQWDVGAVTSLSYVAIINLKERIRTSLTGEKPNLNA